MTRRASNSETMTMLAVMRQFRRSAKVFAAATFLTLLLNPPCAGRQPTTEDAWILEQVASATGAFTLIFTSDAIKATSKRSGFVAIARAPTWRVCVYNPRRKLKYESNLRDFGKYGVIPAIVAQQPMDMSKSVTPKVANVMICGLHCRGYETLHRGNQNGTTSLSTFGRQAKNLGDSRRIYYVTNDIPYTPERGKFLCGLFKHEIFGAIQARQTQAFTSGPSQLEFDTLSVKHQPIAVAELQYPTSGYRLTNVPQEVAEDESERAGLEELFDGVSGFGDTASRKK